MIIAWTYLLHAHYKSKGIEYRYFEMKNTRRRFDRTKRGAYKYWELEACLNERRSPIDKHTANNLRFLIGLRHEIEHQMTSRIDNLLSARFQACCLNYNKYLMKLFGKQYGIEKHLSFSLQFATISTEQKELLEDHQELPAHIRAYIKDFDSDLSEDEYESQQYAYRILFVEKTANRKGQADRVIEFVKRDSPLAETVNVEYAVIKETERPKYLPSQIIKIIHKEGYPQFSMHQHTLLWKELEARDAAKGYGTWVAGVYWHWYARWLDVVRDHCKRNREHYK